MNKTDIFKKALSLINSRRINRKPAVKSSYSRVHLTLGIGLSALIVCGVVAYAATSTILGVGTMPHSEIIDGPATLTARRLTIPPGEVGAWHYHPGVILSVVGTSTNTGAVTIEDGCGGSETFAPGQAFEQIGGRVHRASNLTGETVEEHNMFINPQGTPLTVNIPNNERLCGPARSVDECLRGGWENFNFPDTFPNQGACISFVLKRPRTSLLVP
jgi:quercetin dioxygenase-like cupin family protein